MERGRVALSVLVVAALLTACDFYEYEINEGYSLCTVDTMDSFRLCRISDDGSLLMKLEPAIAAVGYNDEWISLRQCFDGAEAFYSVDAHATRGPHDPVFDGPFDRETWILEAAANPGHWPPFVKEFPIVEERHCPEMD